MRVFGEDPERYLKELGVRVESALDPRHDAVLEASHRSRVGHDTFFFANLEEKAAFDREPLKYLREIGDPVSHRRFRPGATTLSALNRERLYLFESDSTYALFADMPDSFARASYHMIPKPDTTSGH